MAGSSIIIKDPFVEIDGVDYSRQVKSVAVTPNADKVDTTASGDGGHTSKHGLRADTIVLSLFQDADLAALDAALWAIFDGEETVEVNAGYRAQATPENPHWSGNCKLFTYSPLSGDVGSAVMVTPTFEVQGKLERVTT